MYSHNGIRYSDNGLNWTEVKSRGFLANTSSNGLKPCNAFEAKVFIAYAVTDAYNGHVLPVPWSCFVIIFPIVWIYLFHFGTTMIPWADNLHSAL